MKKHQYFVYILHCSDDSLYVGITNNIERRFKEHMEAIHPQSYTASRLPLELVYFEEYQYVLNAIAREKQLKRWSRVKKDALISGETDKLKRLAKKKFE